MDITVTWIDEPRITRRFDIAGRCLECWEVTNPAVASCVIISAEFLGVLMKNWEKRGFDFPDAKRIGGSFNTECPDCGFVAEGFDTEEEAAAWTCDECQPLLPLDD